MLQKHTMGHTWGFDSGSGAISLLYVKEMSQLYWSYIIDTMFIGWLAECLMYTEIDCT